MKSYLYHVLVAVDQLLNAILFGSADETLSARAWRAEQAEKFFGQLTRPVIDGLALVLTAGADIDHCQTAYESELSRKQLPNEYAPKQ